MRTMRPLSSTSSSFRAGWRLTLALCALVPIVTACCSAGRAAAPEPEPTGLVDQRVRELLSGYEYVPSAADWARIGTPAEVAAALMRLAAKPEGQTLAAVRATSSLAYFPRPEVATFLEKRIGDDTLSPTLRGKAAIALGLGFGDAKAKVIAPLFAASDEGLREDAIRAFKTFSSPAAERFLEARLAVEPSERLRAVMTEAKSRIIAMREAKTKANTYGRDLEQLAPISDPGPVRPR
jgi:hypothetical protein